MWKKVDNFFSAGKETNGQTETKKWKWLGCQCQGAEPNFSSGYSVTAVIHKVLLVRIPYQTETMATGHSAQFPRQPDPGPPTPSSPIVSLFRPKKCKPNGNKQP